VGREGMGVEKSEWETYIKRKMLMGREREIGGRKEEKENIKNDI
jgi:hypothetical protein